MNHSNWNIFTWLRWYWVKFCKSLCAVKRCYNKHMSMCTHAYVYVYMCASVHMCACVNRSMYLSGCMCGGICVSVCVCEWAYMCIPNLDPTNDNRWPALTWFRNEKLLKGVWTQHHLGAEAAESMSRMLFASLADCSRLGLAHNSWRSQLSSTDLL